MTRRVKTIHWESNTNGSETGYQVLSGTAVYRLCNGIELDLWGIRISFRFGKNLHPLLVTYPRIKPPFDIFTAILWLVEIRVGFAYSGYTKLRLEKQ